LLVVGSRGKSCIRGGTVVRRISSARSAPTPELRCFHSHLNADRAEQKVLVVGSFASGSDIARELASVNLPSEVLPESMTAFKTSRPADAHTHLDGADVQPTIDEEKRIRVYQSSSQTPNMFTSGLAASEGDDTRPWLRLIEQRPLIERIDTASEKSTIRFKDGSTLTGIDVIIFATGYLYYYPFFKRSDAPWNRPEAQLLDLPIVEGDIVGEGQADVGGMQGLGMRHMDPLMIFLEGDRSMALIGLRKCPYIIRLRGWKLILEE
jgi:hypothetical protein